MTFHQSLAVTLGSELGSTITAQLVAFKVTKYALLFIAAGFFGSLIWKTRRAKSVCMSILGFGLLFLGMDIMSKALEPLRSYEPFLKMMTTIEQPILGILFGMIFTMIVQSSGATSGITVAMAMNGSMSLAQAIPINLGASVGTCITAVLGSLALNREAKRTAYIHIIFQLLGVIMVFIFLMIPFHGSNMWMVFVEWFTRKVMGTTDTARQIATAHTLMPLVNHVFLFPTLALWVKLMDKFYPPREVEKPFGPDFIDDSQLANPPLALEQSRREIMRVGDIVIGMLETTLRVFKKKDGKLADQVSLTDIKADILRNAIVPFLTTVGRQEGLSSELAAQEVSQVYLINELEAIGDIIDKNMMPLAKKMVSHKLRFSDEGYREIVEFHDIIMANFRDALRAMAMNDQELARRITLTKPEIGKHESNLRMRHIERLHKGLSEAHSTSSVHFDLIDQYKRINGHIVSIAYILIGEL